MAVANCEIPIDLGNGWHGGSNSYNRGFAIKDLTEESWENRVGVMSILRGANNRTGAPNVIMTFIRRFNLTQPIYHIHIVLTYSLTLERQLGM